MWQNQKTNLPHFITQEELNDLVRDLSLSKEKAEILGSGLQEWNLLQEETKISHFRDHHSSLAAFYHTSIAGQFPHGNSKRGSNYVMTQSHVLRDEVSAGVPVSAKNTYLKLVAAASPTQPLTATSAPHNTVQIKNAMHHQRIAGRLTQDALYNLHEKAGKSRNLMRIGQWQFRKFYFYLYFSGLV